MDAFMNSVVRKTEETGADLYPSQPWATRALLERVPVSGLVWEPACGGGHMAQVISDEGHEVISSDAYDHGYGMVHDFLSENDVCTPDWIVTNPPFRSRLSLKFTLKALSITPNVAMLNRLSWLEGGERCDELFTVNPPSRVLVMVDRLGFTRETCEIGRRGMLPYAWYVWEEGRHDARIEWVPPGTDQRLTLFTDHERFSRPLVERV